MIGSQWFIVTADPDTNLTQSINERLDAAEVGIRKEKGIEVDHGRTLQRLKPCVVPEWKGQLFRCEDMQEQQLMATCRERSEQFLEDFEFHKAIGQENELAAPAKVISGSARLIAGPTSRKSPAASRHCAKPTGS